MRFMIISLLIACLAPSASGATPRPIMEVGAKSFEAAPPAPSAAAQTFPLAAAAPSAATAVTEGSALAPLSKESASESASASAAPSADDPVEGRALFDHATTPLFDVHLHWHNFSGRASAYAPIKTVLRRLSHGGIRRALLSSAPNANTDRLYKRAPDLFVPAVSPYRRQHDYENGWHRWSSAADLVEKRLRLGEVPYRVIGEFHLYRGEDADSPTVRRLVRLAAEFGLFLHVHTDAVGIQTLFAQDPDARILWAHAGEHNPRKAPGPRALKRLLERYPNLYLELSGRDIVGDDGDFLPGWRALLRRRSDRIMLGTDPWTPLHWKRFRDTIGALRSWLAELPPAAAENFAFRTAERLFGPGTRPFPGRRLPK